MYGGGFAMKVFSVRIDRRTRLTAGCLLLIGVLLVCVVYFIPSGGDVMTVGAVRMDRTVKTNEERVSFLEQFGWQVEADPREVAEVVVPQEFDATYQAYNDIQRLQDCDLEKYKGKRVKRYTYTVLNYPDAQDTVVANLLVSGDKVVGGDVCSLALDGFIHTLALPQEAVSTGAEGR